MTPLENARQLLGVYTSGSFKLDSLLGQPKASNRAHIMAKLLDKEKVPQSQAGITALRTEFYKQAGITGETPDAREKAFLAWARNKPKVRDQQQIDDLVWKHGRNIPQNLLDEGNLEVTVDMLDLADKRAAARLKESLREHQQDPSQGFPDPKKPKLYPLRSLPNGQWFQTPDYRSDTVYIRGTIGRKIDDLGEDVKVEINGKITTWSGGTTVLRKSEEELDFLRSSTDNVTDPMKTEVGMELLEKDGRTLLQAMGVPGVAEMSAKKLTVKLNELTSLVENGATVPEEPAMERLYRQALETVAQGGAVEVVDKIDPNKHKEKSVAVKTKSDKAKKAGTNGKGSAPSANKDQWGCRKDSQAGKINAAITGKPQTLDAVAKKAGCDAGRVRGHVRFWMKKNVPFVLEEDKVYVKAK